MNPATEQVETALTVFERLKEGSITKEQAQFLLKWMDMNVLAESIK